MLRNSTLVAALCLACASLAPRLLAEEPSATSEKVDLLAEATSTFDAMRDEFLADPLFELEDDASNVKVVSDANELTRKFYQLDSRSGWVELSNQAGRDQELRSKIFEKHRQVQQEVDEKFYEKFNAEYTPRLLKIVADDDFLKENKELATNALYLCARALVRAGNGEEIAKIHEREVERRQKALELKDESALKTSVTRLCCVDDSYLSLSSTSYVDWREGSTNDASSDDPNAQFVYLANRLAEECKRDPYLVVNCCDVYARLLKSVDEDLAMEFREKIRATIDAETAVDAYSKVHGHEVRLEDVAIWRPDMIDDSCLFLPEDGTANKYRALLSDFKMRLIWAENSPVRKAAIDDFKSKASVAMTKAALRVGELSTNEAGKHTYDYSGLDEIEFSRESALVLKQAIEEESAKPFDEANARLLVAARVAVLNFELEDAVKSGDKAAALKALERFADYADSGSEAAWKLARTVSKLAREKNEIGVELLDVLLDKARASNGDLRSQTPNLLRAKEATSRP